jgi:hypothetical protein
MSAAPITPPTVPPPPVISTVSIHLNPQDVLEFDWFRIWNGPGAKLGFLLRLVFMTALPIVGVMLLGLIYHRNDLVAALLFGAVFAVFDLVSFGWKLLTLPQRVQKHLRETPSLLKSATYTISEPGLIQEQDGDESVLPWTQFNGMFEGDGAIYLNHPNGARILPRREFASPAASQQFLAQCRARVQAARAARPEA